MHQDKRGVEIAGKEQGIVIVVEMLTRQRCQSACSAHGSGRDELIDIGCHVVEEARIAGAVRRNLPVSSR